MVHLLAAIASDAEHMPSLLYTLKGVVVPPEPAGGGETWGVGYYADDQALTIRKPGELVGSRTFFDLASTVRSRVLIALVQRAGQKTREAPPHRFRRWLFGAVGDIAALDQLRVKILEATPEFIRSELGEASPSELAFAMFLRELHAKNLLSDPLVDAPSLAGALDRTAAAMRMLAAEAGIEAPKTALVATNGRVLLASRNAGGPALHWHVHEGLELPADAPIRHTTMDPQKIAETLKRFRAFVLGVGSQSTPAGWRELGEGVTLWVDRSLTPTPL